MPIKTGLERLATSKKGPLAKNKNKTKKKQKKKLF